MINLNNIISPNYENTRVQSMNSRGKLDTGTHCNYKCKFCYYLDKLDVITDYQEIIRRANLLKDSGITEVDLSGGESSIHKDWFKILDFCKDNFLNISTLSNGSKFKNFQFLEKSKNYGLSEILFSLHGWDDVSHDRKVSHIGGFKGIIDSIIHAEILGIKVRINCTVQEDFDEQKYFEIIKKYSITQVNLLPLNFWDNAINGTINYNKVSYKIKRFIDLMKNDLTTKDIEINVRYIPFCYMIGYEKYLVGTYQHIYDLGDWNIEVYNHDQLAKQISLPGAFETAKNNRKNSYIKPLSCQGCKYLVICDGIEPSAYYSNNLSKVEGETIKDVLHYR